MIEQFKRYIENEKLFKPNDKILLAVSGGIDSVVMAELFFLAGYDFGIAHCNFKLRGKDSDKDEKFVKDLAEKFKVPFFIKRFDTFNYSDENKISIQMAARELRYFWFTELLKNEDYTITATAHHRDDSIETFFINLIRGTGISGLHGILPKQGNVIRPLLFTGRDEIEAFQKEKKIKFREDKSNLSDKYLRNKIRHKLLPVIKEIEPDIEKVMQKNISRFAETENIYFKEIEKKKKKAVKEEKENVVILIDELQKLKPLKTYLYEFLLPYNFSFSDVENITISLEGISGKQFYSPTHRLLKDRNSLIITSLTNNEDQEFFINKSDKEILSPLRLKIKIEKKIELSYDKNIACLDYSKLEFPLILRKWKKGDIFVPFGMTGKKKLSDFFIDQKLSIIQKEQIWLLCSGENIVWIIGHRIDNRYRITKNTKQVFRLAFQG
ncbi:MAG: tRNA lysidine(34) synthetase TilS [Bacteroidales bacterium]|nr:tRNA lysidine(34) synthetase TilS [Bacteroidales bacterium]